MFTLSTSFCKLCYAAALTVPKSPTRPRRTTYHHGSLREALIRAAREILAEQGVSRLSLREVARSVGVSPNAQYRHFRDKSSLLAAVAEQGFRELSAAFRAIEEQSPEARFRAMGVAYVDFATRNPSLLRLMFSEQLGPLKAHPSLAQTAGDAFGQLLAGAAAACGRQPEDPEAACAAIAAWSIVHGYSVLANDGAFATLPIPAPPIEEILQAGPLTPR